MGNSLLVSNAYSCSVLYKDACLTEEFKKLTESELKKLHKKFTMKYSIPHNTMKILSHSSNLGNPTLQTAYARLFCGARKRERTLSIACAPITISCST